jgi:hypothetical protein
MVMLGVLLGGSIAGADVTPTALPFDAALSMYVGHSGTWYNYNAGEEESAEIEDVVAAFEATETFSEDVDLWADHQINDPTIPTGWLFFSPVDEEPMTLHVVIRDTQNRLGDVVVRDRVTSQTVGVLSANEAGSEIDGTLEVSPTAEAYSLEVRDQTLSNVLFTAGANKPWIDKAVVCTHTYGWTPNCGDAHEGDSCPGIGHPLSPPYGDPTSLDGKTASGQPIAIDGCSGPRTYTNDSTIKVTIGSRYSDLQTKHLLRNVDWAPGPALTAAAAESILSAITAARQPFQGGTSFLQGLDVKPYSVSTGHWPVQLTGAVTSIIYLPFRGTAVQEEVWRWKAGLSVNWNLGENELTPAITVSGGYEAGPGTTRRDTQCGVPVPVGDVWGLTCCAGTAATLSAEQCITTPVTFALRADIPYGLIGGLGTAEFDQAWTTPAPPSPGGGTPLVFPGSGELKGLCTVGLAKGWKWKATGEPGTGLGGEDDVYTEGSDGPFMIPGTSQSTLHCELEKLITLNVKAVADQGGAAESCIWLERKPGTTWVYAGDGDTVATGNDQIWTHMGPVGPGTYRVRGHLKNPEGEWGEWVEFEVVPAVELTKTVTVPMPEY